MGRYPTISAVMNITGLDQYQHSVDYNNGIDITQTNEPAEDQHGIGTLLAGSVLKSLFGSTSLFNEKALEDELFSQNYYGFTKEDRDRTDEWWLQHTEKEREELSRQHRYLGKAAHRIGFIIKPTEAGPIKEAYCSCGQKLDLTKNTEFG